MGRRDDDDRLVPPDRPFAPELPGGGEGDGGVRADREAVPVREGGRLEELGLRDAGDEAVRELDLAPRLRMRHGGADPDRRGVRLVGRPGDALREAGEPGAVEGVGRLGLRAGDARALRR